MITEIVCGTVFLGAVGVAFYKLYLDGKEADRRNEIWQECKSRLEKVLDCGSECSEDEALIARLYMGKVFGFEHRDWLYEKIAKKLDVDADKMRELVKSYDPRHVYDE